MGKDLLTISDLKKDEIFNLISKARELKQMTKNGVIYEPLRGKSLAMIFAKASTRTRVSFEAGMTQLGGHAIFLDTGMTQMGRGEPICDTARVLSRYVDCIMIRTYNQSDISEFAKFADVPVINGLSDMCHPCQVLCDILTVQEKKENYLDLKYAFIGDGNNMANSWINAALALGLKLSIATPKGYEPDAALIEKAVKESGGNIVITNDPVEAAAGADVINTDVWISMGQEKETKERLDSFKGFQINEELIRHSADDMILMHCLPVHRGEEVTKEVIEGPHSVIFDQAENRLHIQKSILLSKLISD
jgi:ornithine carbamoyltransferase